MFIFEIIICRSLWRVNPGRTRWSTVRGNTLSTWEWVSALCWPNTHRQPCGWWQPRVTHLVAAVWRRGCGALQGTMRWASALCPSGNGGFACAAIPHCCAHCSVSSFSPPHRCHTCSAGTSKPGGSPTLGTGAAFLMNSPPTSPVLSLSCQSHLCTPLFYATDTGDTWPHWSIKRVSFQKLFRARLRRGLMKVHAKRVKIPLFQLP